MNFDDIRDLILAKDMRRIDLGEVFGSRSTLNVDNRGRSKSKHRGKSKPYSGQAVCGIVKSIGISRKIAKIQRREQFYKYYNCWDN